MDPRLREALTSRDPSFWAPIFVFLASLVVALLVIWTYRDRPFDSTRWKNEKDARPQMVRDLLDNHDLVGKSRESIDTMLGIPSGCDSIGNGKYIYWAGLDGVIDDMWLEIEFSADTVVSRKYCPD
jgi:hypothetical protein